MSFSAVNMLKKVPDAAKKISGKPLGAASKILGAATVASVIYDAHVNAKEKADVYDNKATANRLYNDYNHYAKSDKKSATIIQLKKSWLDFRKNTSLYHCANRVKGYLGEFGSNLLGNLPYLALAGAALKFKTAGKAAGLVLAGLGIKTALFDVAGIGSKKEKI